MTCKTCEHWNLRQNPAMARHQLAPCNMGPIWVTKPPHGKCNDFKQAPADVVEKRVAWLEKAR